MNTACMIFATVIALHSGQASAQEEGARLIDRTSAPLTLRTRIALPGVYGRMDHFGWDTKRGLLIVSALGNDTVEIVGDWKRRNTITGLEHPQAAVYIPEVDRIAVSSQSGKLRFYDAASYVLVRTLDFGNRPVTERRENNTLKITQPPGCGADITAEHHPIAVAPHASFEGHVFFGDGPERSGRDAALFDLRLLFGEGRVAALLGLVKRRGCCLPGGGQRHRPQAELPRLAPKPESGRKALIAARLDDQVKAGATRIGDFPPHWSGLQVFYGKVG